MQTFHRRQSISTDHPRIDYEESEDESIPSSSFSSDNHRLSSSAGIYPTTIFEPNPDLRQSTPSLFHSSTPQCTNSSSQSSS